MLRNCNSSDKRNCYENYLSRTDFLTEIEEGEIYKNTNN